MEDFLKIKKAEIDIGYRMMIFKCKKFGEKVLPNILYAVYYNDEKCIIPFVEKQNGVDEDYANVRFILEEGQYGIFANEFIQL